jgi:hypothetical protein
VSSRNGRERSFPWDSDNSKTEKNEAIFDEWVKKWQESKIMRSIIDPTKATPGELGSWIVKQRSKRKSLEDGEHTNLPQEQVDRLTELGFPLSLETRQKCKFNTGAFPRNYPKLGRGVIDQRVEDKKFLSCTKTTMTREKVAKLTDLSVS